MNSPGRYFERINGHNREKVFSSLSHFFKNGDINAWRVSKCPLDPVDAPTYRQILCTTCTSHYFDFCRGGKKRLFFLPPQRVFVPFQQDRFELLPVFMGDI